MASPSREIKDLEDLLQKQLRKEVKILHQKSKLLTQPGENYGSVMLALDLEIEDEDNLKDNLKLVAKLLPENEMLLEFFQVNITFRKELSFYTKILPALAQIEKEFGVEDDHRASVLFAKCFGGRCNLQSEKDPVDKDAVLLQENLKILGYETEDRLIGLDFETAEFVLRNLAKFHAVSIALKILKPEVFQEVVRDVVRDLAKNNLQEEKTEEFISGIEDILLKNTEGFQKQIEKSKNDLGVKMREGFYDPGNIEDAFVTIAHSDFWVNNMMILRDQSGKPQKLKIVDFQMVQCRSVVKDFLFFMFSSINPSALYDNVDKLIDIYYNSFICCLKKFDVNLEKYSREAFDEEIKNGSLGVLSHVDMMYKHILLERGQISDMTDFNEEDFFDVGTLSEDCKTRIVRTFESFIQRDWV